MKQIYRSRFDRRGPALPVLSYLPAEPQYARREKRNCYDIFIGWSVAVPTDSSARRILRHHDLFKSVGRRPADLTCNVGERKKVIWNARIGARFLACEDVFVSKGIYAAIALMAVKFEWFQRQLLKSLNEMLLLSGRYHVRDITEAGWQFELPE
jgi:hypothetical protein